MKKGQFSISFGMIFSIIIIIFSIAIAVYVINYFLKLQSCTEVVDFYTNLKSEVDNAYGASIANKELSLGVPGGVDEVCFGDVNLARDTNPTEYKSLSLLSERGYNVYFYPMNQKCAKAQPGYKLDRAVVDSFFCVETEGGKVNARLIKEFNQPKVKINKI
jgi:hypothetical protein